MTQVAGDGPTLASCPLNLHLARPVEHFSSFYLKVLFYNLTVFVLSRCSYACCFQLRIFPALKTKLYAAVSLLSIPVCSWLAGEHFVAKEPEIFSWELEESKNVAQRECWQLLYLSSCQKLQLKVNGEADLIELHTLWYIHTHSTILLANCNYVAGWYLPSH